jgi:hypothetical protein
MLGVRLGTVLMGHAVLHRRSSSSANDDRNRVALRQVNILVAQAKPYGF